MKISVYPRGANPRVDRHIQRKSLSYCEDQVNLYGTAEWVDAADHSQGIICRDFLYFGEKIAPPTPTQLEKLKNRLRSGLPPLEPDGCRFIPPPMEKNCTLPRVNLENVLLSALAWDWTMEPANA